MTLAPPPFVAHAAGSVATLVTVLSLGVAIVYVLAVTRRLRLDTAGDLTVPLAYVAVLAVVAPIGGDALERPAAWAVPVGVVLLIAIVLAAVTSWPLLRSGGVAVVVAVAVAAAVLAGPPIDRALTRLYPDVAPSPQPQG